MDFETIKKMSVEDFFKMVTKREINIYDVEYMYSKYHKDCDGCIGKDYCNSNVKTSHCKNVIKYALRGGMENQDPRLALWEDDATWKFVHYKNNKGKIVKVKHKETGKEKYVLLDVNNRYIQDIPDTGWCIADYL